MKKVCHISTLHDRNDIRIFQKELISLSKNYDCSYIVADGKGDETINGVKIVDIGLRLTSRVKRMFSDSKKAYEKAVELEADLYHLHDPELMNIALKLKNLGKHVIYDSHEDLPEQIKTKDYIPKPLRTVLSFYYRNKESTFSQKFDAVVSATPVIRDKFIKYGASSIDICNYPLLDQNFDAPDFSDKSLVYIGGISEPRGILMLLNVALELGCRVNLAGRFFNTEIEAKAKAHKGWKNVTFHGFVGAKQVKEILAKSSIGIVLLKGFKSYRDSLPIKMFEYMNAGIPFIASDFELWKNIANKSDCGVCVNPENQKLIVESIRKLFENSARMKTMGKNGRAAVETIYNWETEKQKLLNLYKTVIS